MEKRPKRKSGNLKRKKRSHVSNTSESPQKTLSTTLTMHVDAMGRMQQNIEPALTDKVAELYAAARAILKSIPDNPPPNQAGDKSAKDAEAAFCNFAEWIINQLGELSRQGQSKPLRAAWNGGRVLAEAIHDVALYEEENSTGPQTQPRDSEALQQIARNALYMPSLRVNTTSFKYDFKKISEKIHLSENFPIRVDPKALYRLDKWPTRFVVHQIEHFMWLKSEYNKTKSEYDAFQSLRSPLRGQIRNTKGLKIRSPIANLLAQPYKTMPPLSFEQWLEANYDTATVKDLQNCVGVEPPKQPPATEWVEGFLAPKIRSCKDLQSLMGSQNYKHLERKALHHKRSTKPSVIKDRLIGRCRQVLNGATFFK